MIEFLVAIAIISILVYGIGMGWVDYHKKTKTNGQCDRNEDFYWFIVDDDIRSNKPAQQSHENFHDNEYFYDGEIDF